MPIAPKAAPVEQTLVFQEIGAYGVRSGSEWFAVQVEGLTPASFRVDEPYAVLTLKNAAGKQHIVQVKSGALVKEWPAGPFPAAETVTPAPVAVPAAQPATPPPTPPAATQKAYVPKGGAADTMSKADWARKDVVIARQAVIKSVLESQGVANLAISLDKTAYAALVLELAEKFEAWVGR